MFYAHGANINIAIITKIIISNNSDLFCFNQYIANPIDIGTQVSKTHILQPVKKPALSLYPITGIYPFVNELNDNHGTIVPNNNWILNAIKTPIMIGL